MIERKEKEAMTIFGLLAVIVSLIIINLYMMLKVIPTYTSFFSVVGGMLPFSTRLVIAISNIFRSYFFLLCLVCLMGFAVFLVVAVVVKDKTAIINAYLVVVSILLASVVLSNFAIRLPLSRLKQKAQEPPFPNATARIPSSLNEMEEFVKREKKKLQEERQVRQHIRDLSFAPQ